MNKAIESLSAEERYSLGLDVLLNMGALTVMSRETGYGVAALQSLRDDFLSAARRGLVQGPVGGADVGEDAGALPRSDVAPLLFELAEGFAEVGRPDRAEDCFRRAVAYDEGNGLYHKGYGLFLYGQGRSGDAEASLEAALERQGEDGEVRALLAAIRRAAGDEVAARAHLDACCQAGAGPPYALGLVLDLLLSTGQREKAAALVERAAGSHGAAADPSALLAVAQAKQRLGEFGAAEDLLRRGIDRWGPQEPFVLLLGAMECLYLGRPREGLARLEDFVRHSPLSAPAVLTLGDMLAATHAWERAEQMYLRAVYRDPNNARAVSSLLDLYSTTNESDKLLHVCRELLEEDPGNTHIRVYLVQSLIERGEFVAVEREIEGLRKLAPNGVGTTALSVYAAFEQGDTTAADAHEARLRDQLGAAAATTVGEIGLLLTLCRYLRLNGDVERTLRLISAMPAGAQQSGGVRIERAMALSEGGDSEGARRLLEDAWQREPFDGFHGTRLAAHLFARCDDRDGALAVLEETRRNAYWSDDFALSLASTTAAIGDTAGALDVLYEYFVAQGRPVPPVASFPPTAGAGGGDDPLTREQRFALAAVTHAMTKVPRKASETLDILRGLAQTSDERRVIEAMAAAPPRGPLTRP